MKHATRSLALIALALIPFASVAQTVTVRKDGTGDFTSIQPALTALAPGGSLDDGNTTNNVVNITDAGLYSENLFTSGGVTIDGTTGGRPTLTSDFGVINVGSTVAGSPVILRNLIVIPGASSTSRAIFTPNNSGAQYHLLLEDVLVAGRSLIVPDTPVSLDGRTPPGVLGVDYRGFGDDPLSFGSSDPLQASSITLTRVVVTGASNTSSLRAVEIFSDNTVFTIGEGCIFSFNAGNAIEIPTTATTGSVFSFAGTAQKPILIHGNAGRALVAQDNPEGPFRNLSHVAIVANGAGNGLQTIRTGDVSGLTGLWSYVTIAGNVNSDFPSVASNNCLFRNDLLTASNVIFAGDAFEDASIEANLYDKNNATAVVTCDGVCIDLSDGPTRLNRLDGPGGGITSTSPGLFVASGAGITNLDPMFESLDIASPDYLKIGNPAFATLGPGGGPLIGAEPDTSGPTPSPTVSPSPTRSPSPSPSPTASPSPTRSPSPTASPTRSPSPSPSSSPTPSPTPSPSPTPVVHVTLTSPNEENGGRFGVSVVGANDMTGDSIADFLIGAQFEDPGPAVSDSGMAYVISGGSLTVAREVSPPTPMLSGQFGRNVRGVGDLNGDGRVDFVASAPNESASGLSGAGRVHVFSGGTGALLHTLVSPNAETGGQFGTRANGINDVTGDGKTDLVISATFENPTGSPIDNGRVYLFNGVTGALLRTLASPNAEAEGVFGTSSIGIKDVTGDGRGEVLVGAPGEAPSGLGLPDNSGMAYMINGVTGAVVWQNPSPDPRLNGRFGSVVSRLDDVTGDGRMDAAVGAPDERGSGRVHLFNGATGAYLRTLMSPNPESGGLFGQSITNILDTNGDNFGDLVIGAPAENADGLTDSGRAYVFSGRTGALLATLSSPEPEAGAEFGFAVGTVPDINADTYVEFLVGARRADPGASPTDAGRAYLFYGKLLP